MTDYEMCIYQSQELTDYCETEYGDPHRAIDRAETFLKGAFQNIDFNTVSFVDSSTDLHCPQQAIRQSFETMCPCDTGYTCSYDHLTAWFKETLECNGYQEGADSTLLLTNGDKPNGGLAYKTGNKAAASTGAHVAGLPSSYEKYGQNTSFEGMETAFHEIGHNILQAGFDDDGDGVDQHDTGIITLWYDNYYKSPLDIEGETNDCGEDNLYTVDGWYMRYSDCAISNFN